MCTRIIRVHIVSHLRMGANSSLCGRTAVRSVREMIPTAKAKTSNACRCLSMCGGRTSGAAPRARPGGALRERSHRRMRNHAVAAACIGGQEYVCRHVFCDFWCPTGVLSVVFPVPRTQFMAASRPGRGAWSRCASTAPVAAGTTACSGTTPHRGPVPPGSAPPPHVLLDKFGAKMSCLLCNQVRCLFFARHRIAMHVS